jgi:hypothetical protein
MTRNEEPTRAPTPDKLDRSSRDKANKTGDGEVKPYPLTEEEATPNTPHSEENHSNKLEEKRDYVASANNSKVAKEPTKRLRDDPISDYNKLVSRPRER